MRKSTEAHYESTKLFELKHATGNNEAIVENAPDDEAKVMQLSAYHSSPIITCRMYVHITKGRLARLCKALMGE